MGLGEVHRESGLAWNMANEETLGRQRARIPTRKRKSMKSPWGSNEANLAWEGGDKEKSDEIPTMGKFMEIWNTFSNNWIPRRVKLQLG